MHPPPEQRVDAVAQRGRERFAARAEMLADALGEGRYLLGDAFSGADIAIGYCCNWGAYTGMLAEHPRLVAYYERLRERPAMRAVFPARESS